ncbi:MAG: urea ABC transporter ATP-binding subunit UrtE [Planctomycetota bacterium]|jgi:urea transport system ATP-binding protein|nr:urea ABC transporter ATP-binding subunit UrtE [Planctomycetota bacterium]
MTLAIKNLSFSYGAVAALDSVSMTMEPGRISCIIGRNGVGKTTLMGNIMGNLRSNDGSISLNGDEIADQAAHKRAKTGLALVPQGRLIFPKLTVEENLRVGLQARSDRSKKIPAEIFEMFPILADFKKRRGGDLSGGQQQQLAIGRALAGDPQILLLDEPTEGIQPNIIQAIGQVLKRLAEERNMTVVLVEQYLDFVKEFGHDFHIMNRGRVVSSGTTDQLNDDLIKEHLSV